MGQYFMIVNIDKKEYIHPHRIGGGLKFWEICANNGARLVPFLLRRSAEGGGGDAEEWYTPPPPGIQDDVEASNTCGRWAGDRIVICGDYDTQDQAITKEEAQKDGWNMERLKPGDFTPEGLVKCTLYVFAQMRFKDISEKVAKDFNAFINMKECEVAYRPRGGE